MNELIQINKQIQEINQRSAWLQTQNGKIKSEQDMTQIFAVMEVYGYRVQGDVKMTIKAWVDILSDYIAIYGIGIIKQAFKSFAINDSRNYKDFPKPSDIINEIKKAGGRDPRITKAHIEKEERERKIVEQWKKEREEYEQRDTNRQND